MMIRRPARIESMAQRNLTPPASSVCPDSPPGKCRIALRLFDQARKQGLPQPLGNPLGDAAPGLRIRITTSASVLPYVFANTCPSPMRSRKISALGTGGGITEVDSLEHVGHFHFRPSRRVSTPFDEQMLISAPAYSRSG